jgi:ABC-type uncharacterized transport system permease subunit
MPVLPYWTFENILRHPEASQMENSAIISMISLTSFLLASSLVVLGFKQSFRPVAGLRLGYFLFIMGTLSVTVDAVQSGATPHFLAAAIAWATVISWFVWKLELVGAFTAPVIAITLLSSIFFAPTRVRNGNINGISLQIHIFSAVIGQTFAILSCGLSLLFLWLDKKLKSKELNDLPARFPAFTTLTKALTITLWIGFTFITISLLTGAVFALNGQLENIPNMYPKILWAILVWVWYLCILVLKEIRGYRPQKVARMSLIGFVLMALSWFGLLSAGSWGLQ